MGDVCQRVAFARLHRAGAVDGKQMVQQERRAKGETEYGLINYVVQEGGGGENEEERLVRP